MFGNNGLAVQAATGIPAIIVLLLVMNWFFHRVYWTGWISHHHKRRRRLLSSTGDVSIRSMMLGFGLLGFTSVYREAFEIVIFLQNLRVAFGSTWCSRASRSDCCSQARSACSRSRCTSVFPTGGC